MTTTAGYIGALIILIGTIGTYFIFTPSQGRQELDSLTFIDSGVAVPTEYRAEYQRIVKNTTESVLAEKDAFGKWEGMVKRGDYSVTNATSPKYTAQTGPGAVAASPTKTEYIEPELITLDSLGLIQKQNTVVKNSFVKSEEEIAKDTLRAFGNALGEKIQEMVQKNSDQNEALMRYVTERNAVSLERLNGIADAYEVLAATLTKTTAPSGFSESTARVSTGYKDIAAMLRAFSGKTTDESLYEQILTYNKSVETFGTAFITLSKTFGAHGITFSPDEPGGIFSPAVSGF